MEKSKVKWHLIAGKIEAVWLIIFGTVILGYVRSGELKLFLEAGWIKFTEVFGFFLAVGGAAILLFCRDNERDNSLYRVQNTGK
ncbi:MAG: hypothetical protein JXA49_11035, partial [Actinobacteria bacterium]|nr:hypothetical protein [Actinomycetota bacterium]